jgi:hypothetical protein
MPQPLAEFISWAILKGFDWFADVSHEGCDLLSPKKDEEFLRGR